MLFHSRDALITLEDLSQNSVDINILVVLRDSLEDPEKDKSRNRKMDADDKAYDRSEDLKDHEDHVEESLDYLPDKARALYRNGSHDDFPVVHACICAVIEDRDRDYGDAGEYIRRPAGYCDFIRVGEKRYRM